MGEENTMKEYTAGGNEKNGTRLQRCSATKAF
jgi:hypothetical protein